MIDNYEHFITRNIKAFYKRRLFSPIVYLVLLLLSWLILPMHSMLVPQTVSNGVSFANIYKNTDRYVKLSFSELNFTGYTSEKHGTTEGYFYYGEYCDELVIVLLSPQTCEEGLPTIKDIQVTGKMVKRQLSYSQLLSDLAKDLSWTTEGISGQLPNYFFSEPDYHMPSTIFMFAAFFGTGAYALICLILYLLYIKFPFLSPACQNLMVFGNSRRMLEEAEEELATLPQLATEDMFITEHYFILTSPYGNAIVPIREILWIYKYSTLHKFLWYHFSISYTLHITANKHMYIHCPKNTKSDIDGIIDYLSEANHDILVGFNEENRLKVQAVQGKPLHIEKLKAFLHRKL